MLVGFPAHAQKTSTGTAFAVSPDGDLLTNQHVINGCTTVTAKLGTTRLAGRVLASDSENDLALIKLSEKTPHFAVIRRSPPIRPGEHAITYGFPLTGALTAEGNLTIGYVSALKGLRNNPNYIQITTPVQPGNSGGPLLDQGGNVIGVVAAKLNAMKVMEETGDVPQNVNFAVALDNTRRFLTENKVAFTEATTTDERRPADIGEKAKLFTYAIECSPERATRVRTRETPDDEPEPRARRPDPDEPQPTPRPRRETATTGKGKEAGFREDPPEEPELKPDEPEPERTPERVTREPGGSTGSNLRR